MSTNLLDLKTIRMVYFIIFVLLIWIWIIAEFINAPYQSNTNKNDSTTQSNDSNPEAE
jgi:ATP/ADP translocase